VDQRLLWLLIPCGIFALLLLDQDESKTTKNPSAGKEKYYLQFNKDEIFKNLIHAEGHFKNIKKKGGVDTEGFMNCAVKHIADSEGHSDEAISHALIAEGKNASNKFHELRDEHRSFRHKLQAGQISAEEGIKRVRKIRRKFESFNPDFDISKCEACTIT